jgi:hypothetical protein
MANSVLVSNVLLTTLRVVLGAWTGAALMFVGVVTSLRYSPLFDDQTKLDHPRVLFPLYYTVAFSAIGAAVVLTVLAWPSIRRRVAFPASLLGLVVLTAVLLAVDYAAVYLPLVEMMTQPGLPHTFQGVHRWSIVLNSVNIVLMLGATIAAGWPGSTTQSNGSFERTDGA